ncbi:MAG: tryptophan 2,3-dioxygenase [Bacteroidetes bacterium]|nr:tryptophan 2,3-dioxygenase [Bacteroidota bacterium]MBI3481456.1 tryptophan 2,3-dioxygenase [Bacteroidota bacterium]
MSNPIDPKLHEQLQKLQQKYDVMGQDLSSYLDGLLYSDYLTYWDYIHLDTLLSLQTPKTHFKDEKVFIVYHQITELYFNLILWEIDQIVEQTNLTEKFFCERMDRMINYFRQLVNSFGVMVDGMDRNQFLKFRMSLLPASGFQSGQYRMIEICSTDMINIVNTDDRKSMTDVDDINRLLEKLYWRSGATELATGKKTLTLKQFEEKYIEDFKTLGEKHRDRNLRKIYLKNFPNSEEVKKRLREFDELANVRWPLAHLKSAARYLQKDPEDIRATGGTNWQKYLPPRFQKIIFYPELWNETEKQEWGKAGLNFGQ